MASTQYLEKAPLGRLVALAGHLAAERWTRFVTEAFGLTPAGAAVVTALGRQGRITHGDLARLCYIRPATLTGVVDTLVRSGHVERRGDDSDRRAVWIKLTAKGKRVAAKVSRRLKDQGPQGSERAIRALTSVDADPTQERIIRRFLIELIQQLSQQKQPA